MATYTTWITQNSRVKVTQAFTGITGHRGKDWNTNITGTHEDTMVRALGDGEVVRSEMGTGGNWSWGNFICVYYPDKNITVLTAHHADRLVTVGQTVTAGQALGNYGTTGNVTGPHCHEEWHVGRGITNNLVTPEDGFPNVEGIYDLQYGGGSSPAPDPTPTPDPDEGDINLLMIKFNYGGHTFTAAASNDPDNYIYFYNGRLLRTKGSDLTVVEEYSTKWGYWMTVNDVTIFGIYNKWLTDLPNA